MIGNVAECRLCDAGELQVWDLAAGAKVVSTLKAHEGMVNGITGCHSAVVISRSPQLLPSASTRGEERYYLQ